MTDRTAVTVQFHQYDGTLHEAEAATAHVVALVDEGAEPFASAGDAWLARLAE